MRRAAMVFLLIAAFLAATLAEGAVAAIPLVGTSDLIENARDYDGREMLFEGEAIGDPLRRGDDAWINVLDSNAAMGIFMPASCAGLVASYGSSGAKGDTLRVRGVFHRACPEHGGDMDIHALSVDIAARGARTPHPIDCRLLALLPPSLLLAAILYPLWRRREAAVGSGKRQY